MAEAYIPHLWQLVEAARQRLQPSREQVAAWERASSMLTGHAARLQNCRNQLATLWPPEQNAASAAYMAELDRLIEASRQTSTAAQSNATHIGHVADAIEQARTKLEPIYREYLENERKLADYQRQVELAGDIGGTAGGAAASRFGLTALGQKAGDFLGEGAMKVLTDPPVSDAQQAALVARARAVQSELDGAARDGGGRIQPPPEYVPPPVSRGDDARQFDDDDADSMVRPPIVPPPARRRPPEPSRPGFVDGAPPLTPDGELPPELVTLPAPVDDGPSLTGIAPPPITAPPPPVAPVPPGPPVGAPPPVPPVAPPTIGVPPGRGPGLGPGLGGGPRGSGPGGSGKIGPLGSGPAGVPPGGVIGARPGGGAGVPGGAARPAGIPRGVNPVGGVIGPQGARPGVAGGARPGPTGGLGAGAAGAKAGTRRPATGGGTSVPGATGGARGRGDRDEPEQRHWDPDNPWEVEQGVTPEIEPNREVSRHEPGAPTLGKDR
ncbi:hypothetical protein ABNF97_16645 [Plantactinospora sp. B6F1]|uniref:hypothetical protein n=1 Tax=Plantactinospora sp. B6F1 TaxID=3158971 RepID=UPI0032D8E11C